MALKPITSPDAAGCPVLQRSSVRLKGRAARMRHAKQQEQNDRDFVARMQVVMICYSLWVGFWFQFVTSIPFNMPAIHTLSGGHWYAPEVWFYLNTPESFPFSMAGNLLFYSSIGSAVALVFGWLFTRGVKGKWRLRFAVLVFVSIILGWSIPAFRADKAAWNQGLPQKIAEARFHWRMVAEQGGDEWHLRHYRKQVEELEALAEQNPYLEKQGKTPHR